MPRGKPTIPTPLDRFLNVEIAVLQRVMDKGRIDIMFDTDNQAANTKLRLWRLRNSLLYYRPNDALSNATRTFVFKKQGHRLTIIDRAISVEYIRMMEAIDKPYMDVEAISDPQERASEKYLSTINFDSASESLVELSKEQGNGNKDKQG